MNLKRTHARNHALIASRSTLSRQVEQQPRGPTCMPWLCLTCMPWLRLTCMPWLCLRCMPGLCLTCMPWLRLNTCWESYACNRMFHSSQFWACISVIDLWEFPAVNRPQFRAWAHAHVVALSAQPGRHVHTLPFAPLYHVHTLPFAPLFHVHTLPFAPLFHVHTLPFAPLFLHVTWKYQYNAAVTYHVNVYARQPAHAMATCIYIFIYIYLYTYMLDSCACWLGSSRHVSGGMQEFQCEGACSLSREIVSSKRTTIARARAYAGKP